MKKRVYLIAAVVSGALAVSGCTTKEGANKFLI